MLSAIVPYPWYAPGLSGISLSVDCPLQITLRHPCWVGLCKGWREKETGGFSPISSKSGYYTVDCLPTVGPLWTGLSTIIHCTQIQPHSPPSSTPTTRMQHVTRSHNYELPFKTTGIQECNFMYRIFTKIIFSFFTVIPVILLNHYCPFLAATCLLWFNKACCCCCY